MAFHIRYFLEGASPRLADLNTIVSAANPKHWIKPVHGDWEEGEVCDGDRVWGLIAIFDADRAPHIYEDEINNQKEEISELPGADTLIEPRLKNCGCVLITDIYCDDTDDAFAVFQSIWDHYHRNGEGFCYVDFEGYYVSSLHDQGHTVEFLEHK